MIETNYKITLNINISFYKLYIDIYEWGKGWVSRWGSAIENIYIQARTQTHTNTQTHIHYDKIKQQATLDTIGITHIVQVSKKRKFSCPKDNTECLICGSNRCSSDHHWSSLTTRPSHSRILITHSINGLLLPITESILRGDGMGAYPDNKTVSITKRYFMALCPIERHISAYIPLQRGE